MGNESRADNRFPSAFSRFEDTQKTGGITIEGFELKTDKDGFIECPDRMAPALLPHGFLKVGSAEHAAWKKTKEVPRGSSFGSVRHTAQPRTLA
jgi:hypothetical protein